MDCATLPGPRRTQGGVSVTLCHESLTTDFECVDCGRRHSPELSTSVCRDCSGKLLVNYDYDRARETFCTNLPPDKLSSSLWRYSALLPVNGEADLLLDVGGTPLLKPASDLPVQLLFKDETRNPSGSIKDRASAVAVACALAETRRTIAVASTGNAASSLACIGAASPLDVKVYVPPSVPAAKLLQMRIFGADVRIVGDTYDDAFQRCMDDCDSDSSIVNRNTAHNPFTREGKKTCSFEIWEQMGRDVPEWVIVPVGDGNVFSGIWKGFRELVQMGLASRVPRMVAAQSVHSNAISRAFRNSRDSNGVRTEVIKAGGIADSLRVGRPADEAAAVMALTESSGTPIEVEDDAILSAISTLARNWGLLVEPAAATSFAAFQALCDQETFTKADRVVCLLTGSGLKDTAALNLAIEKGL